MARKFDIVTIGKCPMPIAEYTQALERALEQCYSELYSIHLQHGDKANALDHSEGLRMAHSALDL